MKMVFHFRCNSGALDDVAAKIRKLRLITPVCSHSSSCRGHDFESANLVAAGTPLAMPTGIRMCWVSGMSPVPGDLARSVNNNGKRISMQSKTHTQFTQIPLIICLPAWSVLFDEPTIRNHCSDWPWPSRIERSLQSYLLYACRAGRRERIQA